MFLGRAADHSKIISRGTEGASYARETNMNVLGRAADHSKMISRGAEGASYARETLLFLRGT